MFQIPSMHSLVSPRGYLLTSIVVLGITLFFPIILFTFGPLLRCGKGEADWSEYGYALGIYQVGFAIPTAIIFAVFMKRLAWKNTARKRIYRWHALLTSVGLILFCAAMFFGVLHAIVWQSYEVTLEAADGMVLLTKLDEHALSTRVGNLITFLACPISMIVTAELFCMQEEA